MNNFEIVLTKNDKDILVANSIEVAKNLNVNHKDLLKKIDGYVEKFKEMKESEGVAKSLAYLEFYIPSEYTHPQNKQQYRNYLITEKGVAQLIGGYSGAVPRAFELNVAYINEFERMKNELQQVSDKDRLLLGLFSKDPMVVAESHKKLVALELKPLQDKIEQDKPLVEFANQVSNNSDLILVREFAKLLADENIKIGEKRLYQWFRENGYILKGKTEPTQRAIEQGLFKVIERVVKTPYGERLTSTTKISGKGQIYFTEKLRKLF